MRSAIWGEPQTLQYLTVLPPLGTCASQLQERVPVIAQLRDRLEHVGERLVLALLGNAGHERGLPAPRELLQRRHVEVAIVKPVLERRHEAREKAPILADGVA